MSYINTLLKQPGSMLVTVDVLRNVLLDLALHTDSFRTTAAENGASQANYMGGLLPSNINSTTVPTVGQLYALPFWSGRGGNVKTLGFNVAVAGGAGSIARVGLYANADPLTAPGTLLLDGGGDIDTTVTGYKTQPASGNFNFQMDPYTLYWLAFICGVAAPTVSGCTGDNPIFGFNNALSVQVGYTKGGVGYGALPATWPASGNPSSGIAAVFVTFNSINHGQP